MLIDLHSHTTRCGHAVGTMEEYVKQALAVGIGEFGFSDHSPWMLLNPGQSMAMTDAAMPGYIDEVRHLKERYNCEGERPFHIRLGMEMDFVPSRLDIARDYIRRYDWDYLIGSIHHIGLWGINVAEESGSFNTYGMENVSEAYFQLLKQLIDARDCDVIGHLDVIKRFGHRPPGGFLRWIEPLLPALKSSGLAVEINAQGKDCPVGEFFPSWDIVEALVAAGVPLTLGADSHAPQQVGRYFPEIIAGLRRLGVKEVVRFERRQPIAVPLNELVASEARI